MITFQNYVYTIISKDVGTTLGTYQNFKRAYERLEQIAKGRPIIDCTTDEDAYTLRFEIYDSKYKCVNKYIIVRDLLSIHDDESLVPVAMVRDIEEANKEKYKSNYKLRTEVM